VVNHLLRVLHHAPAGRVGNADDDVVLPDYVEGVQGADRAASARCAHRGRLWAQAIAAIDNGRMAVAEVAVAEGQSSDSVFYFT